MQPDIFEKAQLLPPQRILLQQLAASPLAERLYLTGGTALAGFYLHHRVSDDLDLFSDTEIPLAAVESFMGNVPGTTVVAYQRLYERKIFLLDVAGAHLKMEFTRYPFPHTTPLDRIDVGLAIDPPIEIFVNKLQALADRREPKDEVDVYFLLRTPGMPSLAEAITFAERKFSLKGLHYMLQSRLLATHTTLPPTTPPVAAMEIAAAFRAEVEHLVANATSEER